MGCLVVLGRNVALLLEILRSDLGDVHVDKISVVSIDFHHLVGVLPINVDIVARADVLVR